GHATPSVRLWSADALCRSVLEFLKVLRLFVAALTETSPTNHVSPFTDYRLMFWYRKVKNRRLGREYVLDVKLRSSQVRAARTRKFVIAGVVIFSLVFSVYALWRIGG